MSLSGRRLQREPLEERRVADVGRIGIPGEPAAGRHGKRLPPIVAAEHVGVLRPEHLRRHRAQHRLLNLALGRPQLAQKHRHARLVRPERLGRQVDRHAPRERVGDDERRRREIVRAHLLLNASFEVAVAAQHRGDDEIARFDFGAHLVGQRPAVADARRAAVPNEVEAELIEVLLEARLPQVLRHDLRPRRQARLHPRFARQPALDRLLGDEPRANHHARVRGVRAARDGRDDDRPVIEARWSRSRHPRPPPPCSPIRQPPTHGPSHPLSRPPSTSTPSLNRARVWNPLFACFSDTRSCGRLGPARLGSIVARSRSIVSEYFGSGSPGLRNSPCAFAYASTSSTRDASRAVSRR